MPSLSPIAIPPAEQEVIRAALRDIGAYALKDDGYGLRFYGGTVPDNSWIRNSGVSLHGGVLYKTADG